MIAPALPSELSDEQRAAVEYTGGNAFVAAGPGTGKTHVLVHRATALLAAGVAPERILTLTFSRRAAAELRDALAGASGTRIDVRTFHGFASRVLEADGPRFRSRRLLDAFGARLVLERAVASVPLATIPAVARESQRFVDDVARFCADASRTTRASFDALRAIAPPRLADLIAVADRVRALRTGMRVADVDELVALAVAALDDPHSPAFRWVNGRYAHILIDEFQDLDRVQLALITRLRAMVFAVGDVAQAIYRFRGAVHGIVRIAIEELAMREFTLTTSRRCPQIVCDLAARTPLIEPPSLISARADAGTIEVRAARTSADEAVLVAEGVSDALASGIAPERIAVLLRTTAPLLPLVHDELRRRRIPVAVSGGASDAVVDVLLGALDILARPSDAEAWEHLLSASSLGFDPLRVRFALARFRGTTLEAWLDAIDAAHVEGRVSAADFSAALREADERWRGGDARATVRRLVRGLRLLDAATPPATIARVRRFIETIGDAQHVLAGLDAPASCADVLAEVRQHGALLDADGIVDAALPGVRLMTVHGSKGLQFDAVIIGDAVEGRFPQEARASSLLRDEDREALRVADIEVTFDASGAEIEEAALWYVAVTRTRSRLLITYAGESPTGAPQRPSRFLPRERIDDGMPPFERPSERLEFATLRLGDAEQRAALARRSTDSPVLRTLLAGGTSAFAAPRGQPTVLRRETVSVSAIVQWLHCPRSFYYRHILALTDESSLSASIGNVLHRILEAFHERFCDFHAVRADDLPVWRAALRTLCAEHLEKLDGGTVGERDAAERFLFRALDAYGERLWEDARVLPFTVEACEKPVRIAFSAGAAKGTIDRVDRFADATLGLRDYKSGRMKAAFAKPLKKALALSEVPLGGNVDNDVNPQLALYRAAFPDEPVSHVSYWYFKGENDERDRLAVDDAVVDAELADALDVLRARVETEFFAAFQHGVESPIAGTSDPATCRYCAYARICPQVLESW